MRAVAPTICPLQVIPHIEREHVGEFLPQIDLKTAHIAPVPGGISPNRRHVLRTFWIVPLLRSTHGFIARRLVVGRQTEHVIAHEVPVQPHLERSGFLGRQEPVAMPSRIIVLVVLFGGIDHAIAIQVVIHGLIGRVLVLEHFVELRTLHKPTVEKAQEALLCDRMRHANARLKRLYCFALGFGNPNRARHAIPRRLGAKPPINIFHHRVLEKDFAAYASVQDHPFKLDLVLNINAKIDGIEAHILLIRPECRLFKRLGEPADIAVRRPIRPPLLIPVVVANHFYAGFHKVLLVHLTRQVRLKAHPLVPIQAPVGHFAVNRVVTVLYAGRGQIRIADIGMSVQAQRVARRRGVGQVHLVKGLRRQGVRHCPVKQPIRVAIIARWIHDVQKDVATIVSQIQPPAFVWTGKGVLLTIVNPPNAQLQIRRRGKRQLPGIARIRRRRQIRIQQRRRGLLPNRAGKKREVTAQRPRDIRIDAMTHFARVVQPLVRLHHIVDAIAIQVGWNLDLLRNPIGIIPVVVAPMHGRVVHVRSPVLLTCGREPIVQHSIVGRTPIARHHRDHAALCIAILGVVPARDHLKFLNRALVQTAPNARARASVVGRRNADAIHHIRHILAVAAADHDLIAFGINGNTRLKLDELAHIAHDGHGLQILRAHDVLARGLIRLDRRALGDHRDFTQFQRLLSNLEINRRRQVALNPDVGLALCVITHHGPGHRIRAGLHQQDHEKPIGIGDCAALCAIDHHIGTRQSFARLGIAHCALHLTRRRRITNTCKNEQGQREHGKHFQNIAHQLMPPLVPKVKFEPGAQIEHLKRKRLGQLPRIVGPKFAEDEMIPRTHIHCYRLRQMRLQPHPQHRSHSRARVFLAI